MSRNFSGWLRSLLFAALLLLLMGRTPRAYAIGCGASQLIGAINTATSGDTINLSASCTYEFIYAYSGTDAALPEIDITLTINGNGAVIERSYIDGTPDFRIFNMTSTGNLTLNNVELDYGNPDSGGGGIQVLNGSLTLNNCSMNYNHGWYGGAVTNSLGTISVSNCYFYGNTAVSSDGGAIYAIGGTVTVNNTTFDSNQSENYGGALMNFASALTVTNSSFFSNWAGDGGGGIGTSSGVMTKVSNSTFDDNRAITSSGNGGAIYNGGGTIVVSNSTLSGNRGVQNGGGIDNQSGTVELGSSIVADNTATYLGQDLRGTITSLGWNVIGNSADATITGTTTGNLTDGAALPLSLPQAAPPLGRGAKTSLARLWRGLDAKHPG